MSSETKNIDTSPISPDNKEDVQLINSNTLPNSSNDNNDFHSAPYLATTKISSEDRKEYMKKYRKNNIDKLTKTFVCSDCGGKFTTSNKSNHLRSKKHKYALLDKENKKLENIKSLITQINDKN
jgi:hypothetical protein